MSIEPDRQYELLLDLRREAFSRFWTVFSLMAAVNGGLFAFTDIEFGDPTSRPLLIFGCLICFVWARLQQRYRFWTNSWEAKLANLEVLHGVLPEDRRVFGADKSDDSSASLAHFRSTKSLAVMMAYLFFTFWLWLVLETTLA